MPLPSSGPIRVAIVHPNRLVRESMAFVVNQQPDMSTVTVVAQASEIWSRLAEVDPHVYVVDLALPARDGLRQAREISNVRPLAAILMTGLADLDGEVLGCCEAGATGYLVRDASLDELIAHIRSVAAGETPCSPKVGALLFGRLRERAREIQRLEALGSPRLTRRELEIIALIEERLSNKEIAVRLDIEVQTVKNHVHNVLEKLDLERRSDVVRYVRERGLIPDPAQRGPALWPLPGTDAGS